MEKKKILVGIIILLCSGCMMYLDEGIEDFDIPEIENLLSNLHNVGNNLTTLDDLKYLSGAVYYLVEYVSEKNDNWQTPYTSYCRGAGDCEDQALLFMYAVLKYLGITSELWVIEDYSGWEYHAIVVVNGTGYIFGLFGEDNDISDNKIARKYSYKQAMMKACFDEMNRR